MYINKGKKPVCKSYILYAHMTFWKRQNYRDSKKIGGCPGSRVLADHETKIVHAKEQLVHQSPEPIHHNWRVINK